ncbi:MAG: LicD family protein [Muribaculaceae bacterium]|nr:LicD family protein [Muribaculaceae bacterium]
MNNLMRTDTEDAYGLKDLQNVILNIAQYIDTLCCAHGINYRLMGGSALGAKRHGGFIPWDDDLDVFMTPSEYEAFRDVFNKYGDKQNYALQELGASNGRLITAKLRLNNSYYEEDIIKGWKIHHGIYVDIFILHTCPDNRLAQWWQYFWAKYIIVKGLANKPYCRRGGLAGFVVKAAGILPKRFLLDFGLRQVYKWRDTSTEYFCNFLGKALFKNGKYHSEDFENTKRVPFETIELNVASGLERFLSARFGNYMKLPSAERIKYEQHASCWDLDAHDYSDRSDEKYFF